MSAFADQKKRDEVIGWSSKLPRARITRWGGIYGTPDFMLQITIKRTLLQTGCPPHILEKLMENCHQGRWPSGLSTFEARVIKNNRQIYDDYICRRIPGRQTVVILSCDNAHMSENSMVEPGLVIMLAFGVEELTI